MKENVVDVKKLGDRIIWKKTDTKLISAYASQVRLEEHNKIILEKY